MLNTVYFVTLNPDNNSVKLDVACWDPLKLTLRWSLEGRIVIEKCLWDKICKKKGKEEQAFILPYPSVIVCGPMRQDVTWEKPFLCR